MSLLDRRRDRLEKRGGGEDEDEGKGERRGVRWVEGWMNGRGGKCLEVNGQGRERMKNGQESGRES